MPEDPSETERGGGWRPPRGIAVSLLISMATWILFGTPLGSGGSGGTGAPRSAGDWVYLPGGQAGDARCGFDGNWAALEFEGAGQTRVGPDLAVQPGDRWEFENAWEAQDYLAALAGSPLPGSPQEGLTEQELAVRLQDAPANWRHGGRTSCVIAPEEGYPRPAATG
ncbi:hypothetical protein [Streptomyces aidingensis]|uniref:Uncharacterized protein n=1 Tax=Streptomyces aidingensis TaxID=910347 RepID=A0A1I1IPN6_9ACTN|nr:hypothetical protein [Streptomyces aidingensis]SFC37891.1 hypothetical protein SAMN05421773_103129 [Streptomyces aidingensis]